MDEEAFAGLEKTEKEAREAEESDGIEQENLLKAEKGKFYYLL